MIRSVPAAFRLLLGCHSNCRRAAQDPFELHVYEYETLRASGVWAASGAGQAAPDAALLN
jgi:hypothetical protein